MTYSESFLQSFFAGARCSPRYTAAGSNKALHHVYLVVHPHALYRSRALDNRPRKFQIVPPDRQDKTIIQEQSTLMNVKSTICGGARHVGNIEAKLRATR